MAKAIAPKDICYYLQKYALEGQWDTFKEYIALNKDIDSHVEAHRPKKYAARIAERYGRDDILGYLEDLGIWIDPEISLGWAIRQKKEGYREKLQEIIKLDGVPWLLHITPYLSDDDRSFLGTISVSNPLTQATLCILAHDWIRLGASLAANPMALAELYGYNASLPAKALDVIGEVEPRYKRPVVDSFFGSKRQQRVRLVRRVNKLLAKDILLPEDLQEGLHIWKENPNITDGLNLRHFNRVAIEEAANWNNAALKIWEPAVQDHSSKPE